MGKSDSTAALLLHLAGGAGSQLSPSHRKFLLAYVACQQLQSVPPVCQARHRAASRVAGACAESRSRCLYFPFISAAFFPPCSYYVNGRSATREDFLSPAVLDTFATAVRDVLEVPAPLTSFPCLASRGRAQKLH